jgi:hypothetical protein
MYKYFNSNKVLFYRSLASYITILAGTVTLNSGGTRHQAAELIMHQGYNGVTIENDVALIRVC